MASTNTLLFVALVALLAASPAAANEKKNKGIGPFKFVGIPTLTNPVPGNISETFVVSGSIALASDPTNTIVGTSTATGIAISLAPPQANSYLTISLAKGIITAQGIGVFTPGVPVTFAITGGTGSYVGLAGTLTATIDADPAKARLVIKTSEPKKGKLLL